MVRKKKTMDYLLQKGYEPALITAIVASVAVNE
jgi:SOS response regulatory protein OraA/RecX